MKVFLMFKDQDFNLNSESNRWSEELIQDLELETIFKAMSCEDEFLYTVAKKALLDNLTDTNDILYRQEILKDCMDNRDIVKQLYNIAVESIGFEKKAYFWFFNKYPESVLHSSVRLMEMFSETLKKLKNLASKYKNQFKSEGFERFFNMVEDELDEEYFSIVKKHLKNLEFNGGMLISVKLGQGNKGKDYTLIKPKKESKSIVEKLFSTRRNSFVLTIHERDEAGAKALSELRGKGVVSVANAVFKSAKHILNFFEILKTELAFYLGALNLYDALHSLGENVCFPQPEEQNKRAISFRGLYDVCLSLMLKRKIVGNDLNIQNKDISAFIITGANRGGKSTFLRSIGLAKIMMQCGIFVGADSFCSNINSKIFTHYKRKEDESMESGKLDEELKRMSAIVDLLDKNSLILFNESFSSTNEMEGSEIAKQIINALLEHKTEIFFVTHMYKFAGDLYERSDKRALFLRAQRQEDGTRTYKIKEGKPLATSYGKDIYLNVFGKQQFFNS